MALMFLQLLLILFVPLLTGLSPAGVHVQQAPSRAAFRLSLLAAEVIMAVRNTSLGEKAAAEIRAQHPSANITVMSCDLSSLQSVKQFAADFTKTGKPCHVLLANADVPIQLDSGWA
jgi:NADP-dependent 3-hydroxy acid dehydrogenase YdfG